MPTEERVLCFERKLFEDLGVFQGISLDVEKYLPVVTSPDKTIYINRSEAELDKRYKQLIPSCSSCAMIASFAIAGARAARKRDCTACSQSALAATSPRRTTAFSRVDLVIANPWCVNLWKKLPWMKPRKRQLPLST